MGFNWHCEVLTLRCVWFDELSFEYEFQDEIEIKYKTDLVKEGSTKKKRLGSNLSWHAPSIKQ